MHPVRADLLTEADLAEKRLPLVKFREGYDRREVDEFLRRVAAEFAARWTALRTSRSAPATAHPRLAAEDVINCRFNATRLREGYDQDAVDDYLDEIVRSIRTFDELGITAGGLVAGTAGAAGILGAAGYRKRPHPFEAEDAWLMGQIAAHFAARDPRTSRPGVDAGAGRSLQAALLLLPWCRNIELAETDPAALEWLTHQALAEHRVSPGSDFTRHSWRNLRTAAGYASIEDPLSTLQGRLTPQPRPITSLPRAAYGIGTLLFPVWDESAVQAFLFSLERGAPYAMAFITSHSTLPEHLITPALARLTRASLLNCPISEPSRKGEPADAHILLALGTA